MGWQSPFRSSPRTAPLATEVVDNTVDYRTLSVGFGTVGGVLGGTWTQAVGTNEVTDVVITSPSTFTTQAVVANTPKIEQRSVLANTRGLDINPTRMNRVLRSREVQNAAWTGSGSKTADYAVGPDGVTLVDRVASTSGASGTIGLANPWNASTIGACSAFIRAVSGTPTSQIIAGSSGTTSAVAALSTTWQRFHVTNVDGAQVVKSAYLADGRDFAANGGVVAGARDEVFDAVQLEQGEYPTTPMLTTTAAVTRAAGYERRPASSYISAGQMRLRMLLSPKGAADKYATDGANIRLFTVQGGPVACYADIATATRILTIVHDATSIAFAVPMGWEADKYMEIEIHVGGSQATRVRYRFCSWLLDPTVEANWGRPFDPSGGASIATIGEISTTGSVDVLSDGTAKTLGATLHLQETFVTTVPAWVLTWLPTDLGTALRMWLRADGGLTLASGVVSAWGDQSSYGQHGTQTTAANRPTPRTSGVRCINSKPVLDFDGTDSLGLTTLAALTEGEGAIVGRRDEDPPLTATAGLWTFGTSGNNVAIPWMDSIVYDDFGSTIRKAVGNPTASLANPFIYSVNSASGEFTVRLNGTQIFTTASNVVGFSTTPSIGGGTYYLLGVIAELVLANRNLTAGERSSLNTFLNTEYAVF